MKSSVKPSLSFRKTDLIAVFAVVLLAAVVFLLCLAPEKDEGSKYATVYLDGEVYKQWPLDTDGEFTVSGEYTNTVSIRNGKISITSSDCPGGDCVHSGSTSSAAKSIVCLPNRVEITVSAIDNEVDFTVR